MSIISEDFENHVIKCENLHTKLEMKDSIKFVVQHKELARQLPCECVIIHLPQGKAILPYKRHEATFLRVLQLEGE